MATIRLIIALACLEFLLRNRLIDQNYWLIGYSLMFGSWIIGSEIGKIGDIFWKLKEFAKEFLEDYYSNKEEDEDE